MSTDTSTYVQGGAEFQYEGRKTKTAMKKAIKEDPTSVLLYGTSSMGPQFNNYASELPDGIEFIVVGPDPYTQRDWYANVKRNKKGGLTVS